MQNDASHAPEVVPGSGADGLIAAPDRAVEAPQSLHESTSPGYAYPPACKDDPPYSSAYGSQDEKLANATAAESGLAHARPNKRKRLIGIIIGAILLALAIGLGVGLGVGLSQSSNDEDQKAESGESQEATQTDLPTTTITPTSATTTPTSSAVTSGSTGLAQFSCNSTQTTTSESGTPYIQECYTQYTVNKPSFYNPSNTTLSNLGGKLTVYTFQDCLDKCDERNEAGTEPPCRAVTYYANLTKPIQLWGGNCFLKNDRGNGFQSDPVDWGHTASAYMSCLNETCWGENV